MDSDPKSALSAINSYGITHLAIPDREPRLVEHIFKEPEAAIDQIKKCFVYDPTGTTKGSDVTIATTADKILANYDAVLEMDRFAENVGEVASSIPLKLQPPPGAQMDHVMEAIHRRAKSEAWRGHPDYEAARHRLDAALSDGYLKEGYRSISVKDALLMLGEE